jgi:hypothetical protein
MVLIAPRRVKTEVVMTAKKKETMVEILKRILLKLIDFGFISET